jgi:hypothetical protein
VHTTPIWRLSDKLANADAGENAWRGATDSSGWIYVGAPRAFRRSSERADRRAQHDATVWVAGPFWDHPHKRCWAVLLVHARPASRVGYRHGKIHSCIQLCPGRTGPLRAQNNPHISNYTVNRSRAAVTQTDLRQPRLAL